MSWCAAYNRSNTNAQISILTSNQLSVWCCYNVTVLLCKAKIQRIQRLLGTLAQRYLRLSFCSLDRGRSGTSVTSRMEFVVATVSGWEPLAVVTKKS